MSPTIAFLSLLLISVQGFEQNLLQNGLSLDSLSLKEEHEGLVSEVKDWLVNTVKDIKTDVDGQMQHLNTVLETSAKEGEQRIHQMYEHSKQKLKTINAPQVCLKTAENELEVSKTSNLKSFLTCHNLTTVGKDLGLIVFEAGKLGTELLLSADDILNGLGRCWSWLNPIKMFTCTFSWIKTAIKDVFGSFKDMKAFTDNVANLVYDIRTQVDYCVHHSSDQLHSHMIDSLTKIHQCSTNMKTEIQ